MERRATPAGSGARGGGIGSSSRYIGRGEELALLDARLDSVAAGNGGLLVLTGPAGVGKTRTAHEIAAAASRRGMVVLWGRCTSDPGARSFAPWAEILEDYVASADAATLTRQLRDTAPVLSRVVPRLRARLGPVGPAAPLEPWEERLRLHAAAGRWLSDAAAIDPFVVILDDLERADLDTLRLLDAAVARIRHERVLVIATLRIEDGVISGWMRAGPTGDASGALLVDLVTAGSTQRLELGGLDAQLLGDYLVEATGRSVPKTVTSAVHAATDGIPLFARELVRHVLEEGVERDPETPAALRRAGLRFDGVVAARAAKLTRDARLVMRTLTAFEAGAVVDVLAPVTGLRRPAVIEALEHALAAGLVRTAGGSNPAYALAHERIREVIEQEVPQRHRAQLHRRIAEVLEAAVAGQERENAATLASHHHASAAIAASPRAQSHALLAAEQARGAYAYARAATLLWMSVDLVPEDDMPVRADLLGRLARAEADAALPAAAAATAEAAVRAAAGRQGGAEPSADVVIDVARELHASSPDAPEWRSLAHAVAGSLALDELAAARLEVALEEVEPFEVEGVRGATWRGATDRAVQVLWQRGDEADRAETLAVERPRTARETAAVLHATASWRRPTSLLRAFRAAVSDLTLRHGNFREGEQRATEYLALADRFGSPPARAWALVALGICHAMLGRLADAQAIDRELDGVVREGGIDVLVSSERRLLRHLLAFLCDGEWPGVARATNAAGARGASGGTLGLLLAGYALLTDIRAGSDDEAREMLPHVLAALNDQEPGAYGQAAAISIASAVAWELGSAEHAPHIRALAERAHAAAPGVHPTGSLLHAAGRAAGLLGVPEEASAVFAHERRTLEEAGLRPLRAIVDHDEGVALAVGPPTAHADARRLLEDVAPRFEELGMPGWSARTRALLDEGFEQATLPGRRLHFTYASGLAPREVAVLRRAAAGHGTPQIARELGLEEAVVARHMASIAAKIGATQPHELAAFARRQGFLPS